MYIRVNDSEREAFEKKASDLGVSVSQLIRQEVLYGAVHVTVPKTQAGFEFRRTGALLKHLYPAHDQRWTAEEKKQWWALMQELREKADKLDAIANGEPGLAKVEV